MEPEKINHPYLTAIKRTDLSVPTRYLLQHDLLKGRILDFGCGFGFDTDELKHQGYDIMGYDYYYRPDFPEGKFDIIICNYVLNVLEPYAQAEVMMNVSNLLSPKGTAYFAVRRDLVEEGFRLHAIHKQYTYQCNVKLTKVTNSTNITISTNFHELKVKNAHFVVCLAEWKSSAKQRLVSHSTTATLFHLVMR